MNDNRHHSARNQLAKGDTMAELVADDHVWSQWKGQMPVLYNKASSAK